MVEKETFDTFTVPEDALRDHLLLENEVGEWIMYPSYELVEATLTHDGVRFVFDSKRTSREDCQGAPPSELVTRLESAMSAIWDRFRRGEITATEFSVLSLQEKDRSGIEVFTLDEDVIFTMIHKLRFPSFWGSFFKIEAWAEPGVGRRIAKVGLTDGGVEFAALHVSVP